ncbi:MAG: hypothetical protein HZB76_05505 [Chlamydiae bacterium]|nr:hypothetical protein [Chlamydiota bacterium]
MQNIHFIQQLYNKYFPQSFAKGLKLTQLPNEWEILSPEEKQKLANDLLSQGEVLLLKEDLSAIKLFNSASQLDPLNPLVWYRQGMAFFEYGTHEKRENALILAGKNFKIATSLDANVFDYWWAWANVLFILGDCKDEKNYYPEAKKKYKHAIALSQNQSKEILAELYWDYGLVSTKIAEESGEAIDLKLAIESFQKSCGFQNDPPFSFWNDFGKAYYQMGLLINDNNIFLQAIECFKRSIVKSAQFIEGWYSLALTYSHLYFSSLNEEYFELADEHFAKALEINPFDSEMYLKWASLLTDSGKINKDNKKLRSAIEKCIKAHRKNKKDPLIFGQWVQALSLLGAYTNRLELIIEAENKIIKAVEIYSEEAKLWYAYGICMEAFGIYYNDLDYDEFAIEKFQIGLSIDKTSFELWQELAFCHAKIGKSTENCDLLEKGIKFYSKALSFNSYYLALIFDYAKTLFDTGNLTANQTLLEEAINYFETGLNLQKNAILVHPEWLFNYACALDLLGDVLQKESYYQKAIEILNHVLLIDPNYPKLHYRLALCLSHILEHQPEPHYFSKAVNCFKLAAKQDEEDDELWLEWGIMIITFAYENLPSQEQHAYFLEAEQKILRSGQLGNEQAYYHLACLLALIGKTEDCINFLKKAEQLEVLPTLEEILEDDWLDNIRSSDEFTQFICQLEKKEKIIE